MFSDCSKGARVCEPDVGTEVELNIVASQAYAKLASSGFWIDCSLLYLVILKV
jgi:hypothetical protein